MLFARYCLNKLTLNKDPDALFHSNLYYYALRLIWS